LPGWKGRQVKLEIRHELRFRYSHPVFLEPLIIRLRPRNDCHQRLLDFHLKIEPEPVGCVDLIDLDGNTAISAWFDGLCPSLRIVATSLVETLRENPFAFILTGIGTDRLPMSYPEALRTSLHPYLKTASDPKVAAFAKDVATFSDGKTLSFLSDLTSKIHEEFQWAIREKGDPVSAGETLAKREGACRDLSVLFMECCRSMGLAVRFVSGYGPGEKGERRHLHAWSEVYLPSGGWRGYDPTHGLAVADGYVALAAGPHPGLAAPTSGAFRGTGAESHLDYDLEIEILT